MPHELRVSFTFHAVIAFFVQVSIKSFSPGFNDRVKCHTSPIHASVTTMIESGVHTNCDQYFL